MKREKKIITQEWDRVLHEFFQKNYFKKLMLFVSNEREIKNVFPVDKDIFNAFKKTLNYDYLQRCSDFFCTKLARSSFMNGKVQSVFD